MPTPEKSKSPGTKKSRNGACSSTDSGTVNPGAPPSGQPNSSMPPQEAVAPVKKQSPVSRRRAVRWARPGGVTMPSRSARWLRERESRRGRLRALVPSPARASAPPSQRTISSRSISAPRMSFVAASGATAVH
ncbi:MAG TPA: hypothetical protein VFZ09_42640 [Archangium sp.]|uniref:hypothetical protein n=1 Tax=Archangium sp. TaxID=1872627 RepID=UPI002E31FD8B|nr:hypothetical protein [Archangium sp.]HEX5752979.1 hypothetical protein [Archangium sp.]